MSTIGSGPSASPPPPPPPPPPKPAASSTTAQTQSADSRSASSTPTTTDKTSSPNSTVRASAETVSANRSQAVASEQATRAAVEGQMNAQASTPSPSSTSAGGWDNKVEAGGAIHTSTSATSETTVGEGKVSASVDPTGAGAKVEATALSHTQKVGDDARHTTKVATGEAHAEVKANGDVDVGASGTAVEETFQKGDTTARVGLGNADAKLKLGDKGVKAEVGVVAAEVEVTHGQSDASQSDDVQVSGYGALGAKGGVQADVTDRDGDGVNEYNVGVKIPTPFGFSVGGSVSAEGNNVIDAAGNLLGQVRRGIFGP